jgi:hypothetical protein
MATKTPVSIDLLHLLDFLSPSRSIPLLILDVIQALLVSLVEFGLQILFGHV